MDQKWKSFRRLFSTLFFLLLTLSIVFVIPVGLYNQLISSQLGPAILKISTGTEKFFLGGLILTLIIIILLGRTYCSLICPLGYLQDLVIWIGKIAGIESSWTIHRKKANKILRLLLFFVLIVMFFIGIGFFTGLLEPFSIYLRTIFLISRIPVFYTLLNRNLLPSLIILISISIILLLSIKKGRFFCSWICPVGTILWGLSFVSIFRLKIDKSLCNGCNKCVKGCKSGAIDDDWEKIDTVLCVGCFNCISTCKDGAIELTRKSRQINIKYVEVKDISIRQNRAVNRRSFLQKMLSGIFVLSFPFGYTGLGFEDEKPKKMVNKKFIFPPGGEDHNRFFQNCTGCMVCAQKCPSKIIFPSVGLSGNAPVFPALYFQNGYCTEDCINCLLVCPTGALRKMSVAEKKTTKIADLELNLNKCIVHTDSLECNVCAEICPVSAIKMIRQKDDTLPLPIVIQKDCIGCGKCLYRCPAKKRETIFIFSINES